jgi:hypothetical protein
MDAIPATLHDPQTGKVLAEIGVLGEPIQVETLVTTAKNLQSFALLSENREIWRAWFTASTLLLRSPVEQHLIRIVMYPAEGEKQGYYEIIRNPGETHEQ